MNDPIAPPDLWSRWLLESRFGSDPQHADFVRRDVQRFRDRVLAAARLAPGMTLADIGAGDGLIAFGAIAQIGPSLNVILTDVSPPLLQHAEKLATNLGIHNQCRFVLGTAEKLDAIPAASVDVVATRASLAYVADKPAAFREFHRILKPSGRISLCEPIMQDDAFETCALGRLIAAQPNHPHIAHLKLVHRWKAAQYPDNEEKVWRNPITNFNERDLARMARESGFINIHLELHIDYLQNPAAANGPSSSWEVFLSLSPHPWAPSLRQIMADQFTPEERLRLENELRPNVESRNWVTSEIVAYLTAEKPPAP